MRLIMVLVLILTTVSCEQTRKQARSHEDAHAMYLRAKALIQSADGQQNAEGWKLLEQAAELGDRDAMSWYVGHIATTDTAFLVRKGETVDFARAQRYLDTLVTSNYKGDAWVKGPGAEWADDLVRKRAGANDPEFDRHKEKIKSLETENVIPVNVWVDDAKRDGGGLVAVVRIEYAGLSNSVAIERYFGAFHNKTFNLRCAATTAKYCDTPLVLAASYSGRLYADNGSLLRWDIYDDSDRLVGRYFLNDSSLASALRVPVEILSVNRERPNPMSSAFMPVLMIRNNSAENREITVHWYAIENWVTVEQGSCYTVGPLLAQSTTRVTCSSLVLGHPNATIKLGAIEQHVRD